MHVELDDSIAKSEGVINGRMLYSALAKIGLDLDGIAETAGHIDFVTAGLAHRLK